jgi:serine/threonine protein kinase
LNDDRSELDDKNIVALKGLCLDPWCLVMEFMPYGDLYSFLRNRDNQIDWPMRLKMAKNMADAIRFLHGFAPKIIHRDLKSPNCLMASINPNDEFLVKVTDFGESRAVATAYTGRDRLQNPGMESFYTLIVKYG